MSEPTLDVLTETKHALGECLRIHHDDTERLKGECTVVNGLALSEWIDEVERLQAREAEATRLIHALSTELFYITDRDDSFKNQSWVGLLKGRTQHYQLEGEQQ